MKTGTFLVPVLLWDQGESLWPLSDAIIDILPALKDRDSYS